MWGGDEVVVKHKYELQVQQIASSLGNGDTDFVFNANDPSQPVTGSSDKAAGYTNMANMWGWSYCMGSVIDFKVFPRYDSEDATFMGGFKMIMWPSLVNNPPAAAAAEPFNFSYPLSKEQTRFGQLQTANGVNYNIRPGHMKYYCSTKKLIGYVTPHLPNLSASTGLPPVFRWYWIVRVQNMGGPVGTGGPTSVTYDAFVRITYYVKWWGRKDAFLSNV